MSLIEQLRAMSDNTTHTAPPSYSFSLVFLLIAIGYFSIELMLRENIVPDPETIQLIGTIGETLSLSIPIPTPDDLSFSQYITNEFEIADNINAHNPEIATAIVEGVIGPEDAEELLAEASAATDEQPQQK